MKEDLTARLITRFGDLLADGSLTPGTRLPPERELAKMFQVSRNSLRQALKVLQVMGVLHRQSGAGTHVGVDASQILREPLRFMLLLDSISHAELLEMRRIVEPELAARAAERANLASLKELDRCLKDMEDAGANVTGIVEADVAFHRAISRAAENRLGEAIFSVIHRSLLSSMTITSTPSTPAFIVKLHRGLYSAIFDRDPDMARKAMLSHLEEAGKVLLGDRAEPKRAVRPKFAPISRVSV